MTWEAQKRKGEVIAWGLALPCGARLTVHRHIDYGPDAWLLSAVGGHLHVTAMKLGSTDIEHAKIQAVDYVRQACQSVLKDLEA